MSRYLIRLFAFAWALLLAVCGANYLVNPYGYFESPRIRGVNALALGFNHRLPLAKALAVEKLRPATVVLGNSRAEAGYDPEHPAIQYRPAYNAAVGGANVQAIRRYALEALATGELRHLIVAVDFTMFDPAAWRDVTDESPFIADRDGHAQGPGRRVARLATALLSGTALADSWWSLTHQRRSVARYLPSGVRDDSYDIDQAAREGGPRSASLRTESDFLAAALRELRSPPARSTYARAMDDFRQVVALASARGVRVTVLFNPIHARQTYLFAASGLWGAYEAWKYDVVAAATSAQTAEVWDFSGVSSCTSEPLPLKGDATTQMRWYRETSHFRRPLGNLVLERIAGHEGNELCPGLGYRLDAGKLTEVLAVQRSSMERWADNHPQDIAELNSLARLHGRCP